MLQFLLREIQRVGGGLKRFLCGLFIFRHAHLLQSPLQRFVWAFVAELLLHLVRQLCEFLRHLLHLLLAFRAVWHLRDFLQFFACLFERFVQCGRVAFFQLLKHLLHLAGLLVCSKLLRRPLHVFHELRQIGRGLLPQIGDVLRLLVQLLGIVRLQLRLHVLQRFVEFAESLLHLLF